MMAAKSLGFMELRHAVNHSVMLHNHQIVVCQCSEVLYKYRMQHGGKCSFIVYSTHIDILSELRKTSQSFSQD